RLQWQSAPQFSVRDPSNDAGDATHLVGQVARHRVHVVGQVLPGAGHAFHVGLASQLAVGADLAGHARHLFGERVELVDHRVDGVLELEDLTADVDGDPFRQVALLDRGRDLSDVADLARQVAGHDVDVVGEVLPDAAHADNLGLTPQPALVADLAGHARHLVGERVELV